MKELPLIVKADVQGSAEAVKASLEKLSNDEVRVKVIHTGVGAINESDILLGSTAGAIIVGFNVRADAAAQASGQRAKVDIRYYRVIYDAIDEIEAAMKGMLAPKFQEVVIGHAEVRMTYKVSAVGTIAGCMVKDGKVTRDAKVRVLRDNIVIHEGEVGSLQRFKDAAKEVTAGYECGMSILKFNDIKEGDIFECFAMEQIKTVTESPSPENRGWGFAFCRKRRRKLWRPIESDESTRKFKRSFPPCCESQGPPGAGYHDFHYPCGNHPGFAVCQDLCELFAGGAGSGCPEGAQVRRRLPAAGAGSEFAAALHPGAGVGAG